MTQDGTVTKGELRLPHQHDDLKRLLVPSSSMHPALCRARILARWPRHVRRHLALLALLQAHGLPDLPDVETIATRLDLVSKLLGTADLSSADERLKLAALLIGDMIDREENPASGLIPRARASGVNLALLSDQITACLSRMPVSGDAEKPRRRSAAILAASGLNPPMGKGDGNFKRF